MHEMNIEPEPALPVGTPPTVDEAKRILVGDFYRSFKFSQGSGNVQYLLFKALTSRYQQLWTPQGLDMILPDALEASQEQATSITLPAYHPRITAEKLETEIKEEWQVFNEVLKGANATQLSEKGLLYRALQFSIPLRDGRQVALGRYNRPTETEKYQSYYRTHVLDKQTTHSVAFDMVFSALRERQLKTPPPVTLRFLRAAWELRHKDELFYPESFQNDLANSSLYTRLGHKSLTRRIPEKAIILLSNKIRRPRT